MIKEGTAPVKTLDSSKDFLVGIKQNTEGFFEEVRVAPNFTGQLLGKLLGANLNTTADQLITLIGGKKFIVTNIVITNASTNIDTAAGSNWYTGLGGTGDWIASYVSSTNIRFLTDSTQYVAIHNAMLKAKTTVVNGNTLYYFLSTAQGSPATADIYVYGIILE